MNNFSAPAHLKSTDSTTESTSSALQRTDALDIEPISEDLSYYPLAFISCCLPYRDPCKRPGITPTESLTWTRTNGPVSLSLTAGAYTDGHGETQLHLPYGRYARVLLMWLTTSALRYQSRSFPLPTSTRAFLEDLHIAWNADRARDVITQLRALLATQCVVTHSEKRGENFVDLTEERFTIGTRARLHFSTDADSQDFDPFAQSQIELSERFYSYLTAGNIAPVVLTRWRQLIEENVSPLAADLFLWMAYRAPQISCDTRVSWANLRSQLGSFVSPSREREFAATVTRALGKVAEVYPEMQFTVAGAGARSGFRGLILHPSPDADLLGLNPRLQHQELAKAQAAAERAGLSEPATVRRDVNLNKLRAELVHGGLKAAESASDELLKAAVDVVLNRATKKPAHPQAFVRVSIAKEPELLTGTASPVAPAQAPTAPAAPSQGAASLSSGRPVLPVAPCPVHGQDVTGLVCRDCAVELKSADTDSTLAESCWRAVRARLTELSHLDGVDTSGEWVRYSSLATAHGVEA